MNCAIVGYVPEIDSILEKMASQEKVIMCMNPFAEHFDITYYNKPTEWHT